ncbi:hydrolase TatD [Idiomarina tyrosinivorans]|uniref:Hydrolase TatD n=1 Tax=Idiomarina tyrosinivorans TaxID=1445662 RepID=A0A432ZQ31_9GAMM|nr:TatD family hydrolase [Idiomarina tyrosinivorans]RUO80007.1 hydrolase TatD [Idiomarina tyrosinivorans]
MWIDAGVNLTNSRFHGKVDEVIENARRAGVQHCIVIATSVAEAEAAIALCQQFPHYLKTTAGIHPHDAGQVKASDWQLLREFLQHPDVVAVGECGLDFNRNYTPQTEQLAVFEKQLELAAMTQMPVYLHERDAQPQVLQLLDKFGDKLPQRLSHCFTGDRAALAEYLRRDHYIGITGWVCDERRNGPLLDALTLIPDNRLLLETDAPFLLPRSIRPRPKMNEPAWVAEVGRVVAQQRQVEPEVLAQQTSANSQRFFQLST